MKAKLVLAGAALIEIVMALVLFPLIDHAHIQTTDFVNFYAAATIVRDGHGSTLYTPETQQAALKAILGYPAAEYFLHPAFEAAALVPLTYLKIEHAFVVWTLINLALLGVLPLVLAGYVPLIDRRPYLGLLGFAFPPVLAALTLGQDSVLVMFVISAAYLLSTRKLDFVAGLVLALATVKFQYVLILVLLLLISRKFRLVAGFAVGCVALALVTLSIVGTAGGWEYFRFVHQFDVHNGYGNISPDRMMNLRGFLAGLGFSAHQRFYGAIGSAILLVSGIVCSRPARQMKNAALGFALYLAIALAAAPYDYFQDVAILLPAIFIATDAAVSGIHSRLRTLILLCCGLFFVWPAVLLALGGHYFWNSRIYLMFPLVLLFATTLALQLLSENTIPI
jgi:alpha-1,2-mannosyltransferase